MAINQKFTGDVNDLLKEIERLRAQQIKLEEGMNKAAKAGEKGQKEFQEQIKAGIALTKQLEREEETLAQKHQRMRLELTAAWSEGKITSAQYATNLAILDKRLEDTSEAAIKLKSALQDQVSAGVAAARQISRQIETDAQKHQRLRAELTAAWNAGEIASKEYADALLEVDRRAAHAAATAGGIKTKVSGNATAISEMNSGILKTVAAWVSVREVIQIATQALQEHNAEREKGKSETQRLEDSRKELRQLARDSADYSAMETRADAAAQKFGVDRTRARLVLANARSLGYEANYEDIIRSDPIMKAESAGVIAGQIRQIFASENIPIPQAQNAFLQASNFSNLNTEQLIGIIPQITEGGKQQKASFNEALAAAAVMSTEFKSPETTGDRLNRLLSKLSANTETAGLGLLGGVDVVQAMTEKQRSKFLGDSMELRSAYAAVSSKEDVIRQQISEIEKVRTTGSLMEDKIGMVYQDPTFQYSVYASGAEQLRAAESERAYSSRQARNQAYRDFTNARMTRQGTSSFGRWTVNRAMDVSEMLGEDTASTTGRGTATADEFKRWMDENTGAIKEQTKALEAIRKNTAQSAKVSPSANRNAGQEAD